MAGTDNHRNSGSRRVNMKIWGGVPLVFHILSAIKLLNDLKVKARSQFPNVWEEYKHHSNPYIQDRTL